jgi:CheY-like chemotaxis protein
MFDAMCLVADPSPAMRNLMRDVISEAGYETLEAASVEAVAERVHSHELISAGSMLLVLGAKWAEQCAMAISLAATRRYHLGLEHARLVLIYESGTLRVFDRPAPAHCDTVAVLEKPFETDSLGDIVSLTRSDAVGTQP